jgi:hypothetical protein
MQMIVSNSYLRVTITQQLLGLMAVTQGHLLGFKHK